MTTDDALREGGRKGEELGMTKMSWLERGGIGEQREE